MRIHQVGMINNSPSNAVLLPLLLLLVLLLCCVCASCTVVRSHILHVRHTLRF
jgi:hypothetical protein